MSELDKGTTGEKHGDRVTCQGHSARAARLRRYIALAGVVLLQVALASPARAAPGDLDPTFGTAGKVTTDFGSADSAFAVAIQADGKIVAAGASGAFGSGNFVLSRYNANGSLDSSFGTGGKVTTAFSGGTSASALAVAIQADGKIVAAGVLGCDPACGQFALARYNADGSLDSSFGTAGRVTTDFGKNEQANAVAIQADGKIVAAGSSCSPFGNFSGNCDIALARYNADGSLDASFGAGGKVATGGGNGAAAVAIQADGKIVVAGVSFVSSSDANFMVARYNANGSLDASFGIGGKVTADFGGSESASAVALQADGKIVVAGVTGAGDFALVRYNADGSLDTSFGAGGKVTTDFTGVGGVDGASGVALQAGGKIVAVGGTFVVGVGGNIALARYKPDGSLDSSFGTGGKVTTSFAGTSNYGARAVAIQADGKIVAAGFAEFGGFPVVDFALARYLSESPTIPVAIDIKPGSFPNSINPESKGNIPVAILSTADFDAPAMVKKSSLTFGRIGSEASLAFCNVLPVDVNGDNLLDVVCHFDTQAAAFQRGDTQGILKGKTVGGTALSGTDSVRIVP